MDAKGSNDSSDQFRTKVSDGIPGPRITQGLVLESRSRLHAMDRLNHRGRKVTMDHCR